MLATIDGATGSRACRARANEIETSVIDDVIQADSKNQK